MFSPIVTARSRGPLVLLACLLLVSPDRLAAQESAGDGWAFSVAPYVWFVTVEGRSTPITGLPAVDVDAGFGDIIDNANFALLALVEARKGRWGATADLVYMNLGAEGDTPGPLFSGVEAEATSFIGTFAGNYRAFEDKRVWLDFLAGARVWYADTELTAKAGLLPEIGGGASETWVDPIIGARTAIDLGRGFALRAYGDIGPFGVSSDLTWQAYGGLSYGISRSVAVEAGYRYLHVDYDEDAFVYDLDFHGPIVGGRFRF